MDNYPAGAANDSRAPWNEPEGVEIEVTVTATLVKETVVMGSGSHKCVECEIEPDGSRSYIGFEESDDDVDDLFRDQQRTPLEIIQACEWICRQLNKEGRHFVHCEIKKGSKRCIDVRRLLIDCMDWEETEIRIEELKN